MSYLDLTKEIVAIIALAEERNLLRPEFAKDWESKFKEKSDENNSLLSLVNEREVTPWAAVYHPGSIQKRKNILKTLDHLKGLESTPGHKAAQENLTEIRTLVEHAPTNPIAMKKLASLSPEVERTYDKLKQIENNHRKMQEIYYELNELPHDSAIFKVISSGELSFSFNETFKSSFENSSSNLSIANERLTDECRKILFAEIKKIDNFGNKKKKTGKVNAAIYHFVVTGMQNRSIDAAHASEIFDFYELKQLKV